MKAAQTQQDPSGRLPMNIPRGVSTFGIGVVGFMSANLVPLMILALTADHGMPPATAGLLMTVCLLCSAGAALGTARITSGRGRYAVARVGLVMVAAGFGMAATVPSLPLVIAGILLGGLGAGGAVSAGGAALAALSNPNRVAALSGLVNRAVVTVVLAVAPLVGAAMLGAFGLLAALGAAALFTVQWLPPSPVADSKLLESSGARKLAPLRQPRFTVAGWVLLVCFALWAVGEDSLWAVAATMGAEQASLDDAGLALVLSASTAGGLVIAVVLAAIGQRLGRVIPLAVLLALGAVLKLSATLVHTQGAYLGVVIAWNTVYAAAFMYVVAVAAALDATGRWSGPLLGVYLVGSAFAPVVGTFIAQQWGYGMLGWVLAGFTAVLFAPMLYSARMSREAERLQSASNDRLEQAASNQ